MKGLAEQVSDSIESQTKKNMELGLTEDESRFLANVSFQLMALRMNRWPIADDWIDKPLKEWEEKFGEKVSDKLFLYLGLLCFRYVSPSEKK